MKELELKPEIKTEISVKHKKQVSHELIGEIIPYDGHVIWEVNIKTMSVNRAKFSNVTYTFGSQNKKEIIVRDGFFYVSAINKKNALKKFNKGKNGSKEIDKNPMSLYR